MPARTPPCEVYPQWTEAKFRAFIIGGLRALHNKWPPMHEAKERARRDIPLKERRERNIKYRKEYQCANCGEWEREKTGKKMNHQMDHIEPVGTTKIQLDNYITHIFRPTEEYQCLCLSCHKAKSEEDRRLIREQSKEISPDAGIKASTTRRVSKPRKRSDKPKRA